MEMASHAAPLRYTGKCVHCARTIFHGARLIGHLQLSMIENHLLICRPLVALDGVADLLEHCRISETTV
jgi:hypothetical protein